MSKSPQDDNLLSPELSTDEDFEEILRECERNRLYESICKELATIQWQIVEKIDPETGFIWQVLTGPDGAPLWAINHADKGIAAMVVKALLQGFTRGQDSERNKTLDQLGELELFDPMKMPWAN